MFADTTGRICLFVSPKPVWSLDVSQLLNVDPG